MERKTQMPKIWPKKENIKFYQTSYVLLSSASSSSATKQMKKKTFQNAPIKLQDPTETQEFPL